MGKVKNEITELFETCERKYEEGGSAAVIDYIEEAKRQGDNMLMLNVQYRHCHVCDADMPSLNDLCLVCGQVVDKLEEPVSDRQVLIDVVIEDLKNGFAHGDYTVLDELLSMLPTKNLIQALPEERWKQFDELKKDYFEIVKQGFNEELQREEIQVHCGENGNLFLIKTEEGFVVDVYNQDKNVNTMAIWEDDLTPEEE